MKREERKAMTAHLHSNIHHEMFVDIEYEDGHVEKGIEVCDHRYPERKAIEDGEETKVSDGSSEI